VQPGVWKVIGASVAGDSHVSCGTDCQDASGWRRQSGITCLAVADGAGSRPLSATGSALAVEQALDTIAGLAADESAPADLTDWLRSAFDRAQDRIAAFASSMERQPGDYATTLAVAIVTPDRVAIGQVGDSIVVIGGPGQYLTVCPETKGEYANETYFITTRDWAEHLRVAVLAGRADVVALSTDGLRYKITNIRTSAAFGPFFDGLVTYGKDAAASSDGIGTFLAGLENDQTGDDKSLVAAVQVAASESLARDGGEQWPDVPAADPAGTPPSLPVTARG
jgi:hypothetical protein